MTVSRRQLLSALAIGLAPAMRTLAAKPPAKIYRIGHLSGSGEAGSKTNTDAFKQGMKELGYVEGDNWIFEQRFAGGQTDRLASLAQELIAWKPDVLLVSTTPGNLTAKAATATIPIVMVSVADPVGTGIVASLARPGGNITGVTNIVAELAGKRVELLKEMIPGATHIAVIVNPDNPNAAPQMKSAEAAAKQLKIELRPIIAMRSAAELEKALEAAARGAPAAIRMIDPLVFMLRRETAALAAKLKLPMIYSTPEDAEAGGLIAYGADIPSQYRQCATFVGKILRGAKPADLPVEQPTTFELVVNLKAAKALGLKVPQGIMVRANRFIE
jgi:putative ABC transport system substrate-binding protein